MRHLLSVIAFLALTTAWGQKMAKYSDALPGILTMPASGALAQLQLYLPVEPQNPSIYLQMAVIYEKRYRNSDPIKDYPYKYGNAVEALKAYQRTAQFISDKEVKRNTDLYFNFGKYDDKGRLNVNYDSLSAKMTASQRELTLFVEKAPKVYEQFTGSFSHYDNAHKLYSEILGKYPTFKELYLLYNSDVDRTFEAIKKEYQESMRFWDGYRAALSEYAIGYNQQMEIQPIRTYRLDGIEAKINFLTPKIKVWDYARWVDETRAAIRAEINTLRSQLTAENGRLDERLGSVDVDFSGDAFQPLRVSKEVLFVLRKYDLTSVIEPIFLYKQKKHEWLYQQLLSQSLDSTSGANTDRKLYLLGQQINLIRQADTILQEIVTRNTTASLARYPDFVKAHYQNQAGIGSFVKQEQQSAEVALRTAVDQIQTSLYSRFMADTLAKSLTFKKLSIPVHLSLTPTDDQLGDARVTTHRVRNFDGSMFVGGVFKNAKEKKTQVFVAGILKDQKVSWYNEYLLKIDSSAGFNPTRLGAMQAVPGGVALVLHGYDTSGASINHLMILDEAGQVTLSRRLDFNQFPRKLNYEERGNSLTIVYKGADYTDDVLTSTDLIVANYNILGDLNWQQRTQIKGNVVELVNVDQGYILVGNFSELKGLDGRMQRSGGTNLDMHLFAMKVSAQGTFQQMKTIPYSQPFFCTKVHKVSDDCINVFGEMGSYREILHVKDDAEVAVHLILSKNLEVLSSSLK